MKIISILIILSFTTPNTAIASGDSGMLFGGNHAFRVTATDGWILDNESGIKQGLHMIFYPKGETWANSPVIIYGRAMSTSEMPNVNSLVAKTVNDFHVNGSLNYKSEKQDPLILKGRGAAEIYFFTGDKWGNHEAVAYFQEADTVNFLVFNSKTKENFQKHIHSFYKIVSSYNNLYASSKLITKDMSKILKKESSTMLEKSGVKEYESKAINAVGSFMASTIRSCTSYFKGKKLSKFDYFVRINGNGSIKKSYISPASAFNICFDGLMSSAEYPPHKLGAFLLNIEMNFK